MKSVGPAFSREEIAKLLSVSTVSPRMLPREIRSLCLPIYRLLGEGHPVSSEQIAAALSISPEEVNHALCQFPCGILEFDQEGRVVEFFGLSLNPTQHSLQVNGRELFTWCAVDTLFLPALLRKSAMVESLCPVTGSRIRLSVAPEGIKRIDPPGAVVSMVIPGVTASLGDPQVSFCHNVHFFSSREAGSQWLSEHPRAVILSVDEAYELTQDVWVRPFLNTGG